MGEIIITEQAADLLQIVFNPEAEGVLYKRALPEKLKRPVDLIRSGQIFDLSANNLATHQYLEDTEFFESNQIAIDTDQESSFPELRALWDERRNTQRMLCELFKTPIGINPLTVQPPGRTCPDNTPHKDKDAFTAKELAEGLDKKTQRYLILVSHTEDGTGAIPRRFAGQGTSNTETHTIEYLQCPKIHAKTASAKIHDIFAMRTGITGTVHWARIPENIRAWTMYYTEKPMLHVAENFSLQITNDLI